MRPSTLTLIPRSLSSLHPRSLQSRQQPSLPPLASTKGLSAVASLPMSLRLPSTDASTERMGPITAQRALLGPFLNARRRLFLSPARSVPADRLLPTPLKIDASSVKQGLSLPQKELRRAFLAQQDLPNPREDPRCALLALLDISPEAERLRARHAREVLIPISCAPAIHFLPGSDFEFCAASR